MAYNKIITSEGNVQFQTADGSIINVHPFHIYTTFNEDTVSFILIAMPKSSGLAIFTSKASDLEVDGTVYTIEQLPNALSEAFAKAGAVARYEIVDELPTSGQSNTIYLVPKEDGEGYDEYIYVNGEWELIGDTDIELDRYVDKETFSGYTADTLVLINTVSGNVITESERAISAETSLSSAIDTEISNREAADSVISGAVDTLSTNLSNEVQRAQNAESALDSKINALSGNVDDVQAEVDVLSADLEDEVSARTQADEVLDDKIDGKVVELTQAEYDSLVDKNPSVLYVITDAVEVNMNDYYKKTETSGATEIQTALDAKVNTSDFNTYSANTQTAINAKQDTLVAGSGITISGNVISAEAQPITVDNALDDSSENPVQNKALYDELRLNVTEQTETLLQWEQHDGGESTNYPSGCTKITVEVDENEMTYGAYSLNNNNYDCFGNFVIESNGGVITVSTTDCESQPTTSITYSISDNVVTIEYPTITNVTIIGTSYDNYWTIKAISETSSVTPLIDQVSANTTALGAVDSRLAEDEEVTAAGLNALNESKQDTLVSGTNIKTINNESILGSGNIDIQGGGGKELSGGTNISITTGETADTINCTLPYYIDSGNCWTIFGDSSANSNKSTGTYDSVYIGYNNEIKNTNISITRKTQKNILIGWNNKLDSYYNSSGLGFNAIIGHGNTLSGSNNIRESYVIGSYNTGHTSYEFICGWSNEVRNSCETSFGYYNNSVSASTTFGDSGNTLFSVGNGTSTSARHNAFEIRQNGDIYLTKDGQDVKLQDQLGGSSITVDTALDSGSTNPVENRVIYNKIDEVEQVTAAGLNALNDNFGGLKLVKLTQAEYNALATKDSSTLYIIVN